MRVTIHSMVVDKAQIDVIMILYYLGPITAKQETGGDEIPFAFHRRWNARD